MTEQFRSPIKLQFPLDLFSRFSHAFSRLTPFRVSGLLNCESLLMKRLTQYLAAFVFIAVLFFILAATHLEIFSIPKQVLFFEMQAQSRQLTQAILYHDIKNEGRIWEEDYTKFQINSSEKFVPVRLKLPEWPIRFLRLDLMPVLNGELVLTELKITDEHGKIVRAIHADDLIDLSYSTERSVTNGVIHLAWQAQGEPPMVWFNLDYPLRTAPKPWRVGQNTIMCLGILMSLAVLLGVWTIYRVLSRKISDATGPTEAISTALFWAVAAGVVILGAKMILIGYYGVEAPCWDTWDAEGWALYTAYLNNDLSWQVMFEPHNEHRILFSRIFHMMVFLLEGEWDDLVQLLANAALHTAIGVSLILMLWHMAGRRFLFWIAGIVMLLMGLPFAWENTIGPLQDVFYFLLLFAILAIWLLALSPPWSARWWLGLTFALCDIFTLSSGGIAICAVMAVVLLRLLRDRRSWRTELTTLIAGGGVILFATHYRVIERGHLGWFAHDVGSFLKTFLFTGSWPWIQTPWIFPLVWAPSILLLVYYFVTRKKTLRMEEMLLGLTAWIGLQVVAIGFFRGSGGRPPEWRYMDNLSMIILANGLCSLWMTLWVGELHIPRRVWQGSLVLWWTCMLVGVLHLSWQAIALPIPQRKAGLELSTQAMYDYFQHHDLQKYMHLPDSRMPYVRWIMPTFLNNTRIRQILPSSVRDELPVEPDPRVPISFRLDGCDPEIPLTPNRHAWGSYTAAGEQKNILQFRSGSLNCTNFPYLTFEVIGDLGEPNLILQLRGLFSGKLYPVQPETPSGDRWQKVVVKCPPGPFVIEALDARPDKWFAFRRPTGKYRLSAWTTICLQHSFLVFSWGLAALIGWVAYQAGRRYYQYQNRPQPVRPAQFRTQEDVSFSGKKR